MADVAVESPVALKKAAPSVIPTIDNFEGVSTEGGDDYANLKKLQRQLECVASAQPSPAYADIRADISNCKRNTSRMSKGLFYILSSTLKRPQF